MRLAFPKEMPVPGKRFSGTFPLAFKTITRICQFIVTVRVVECAPLAAVPVTGICTAPAIICAMAADLDGRVLVSPEYCAVIT